MLICSKMKNVFGFTVQSQEMFHLEKTASFFHPSEDGDESSRSTQNTEDGKDTPTPKTPDQNIRLKVKGKIFTIKQRIHSARVERPSDLAKRISDDATVSIRNLPKVHNSDETKKWGGLTPTSNNTILQGIKSEGNSRMSDSLEDKNFIEDSNESLNQNLNLNKPFSIDNKQNLIQPQNMFVIKSQSQNKIKVAKFNKIKALTPIPNMESLLTPTSKNVPISFRSESKLSPVDRPILPIIMPETMRAKPASSEIKRVQLNINTPQSRPISHTKSFSTIGKAPQVFTFNEVLSNKTPGKSLPITERKVNPEVNEFDVSDLKLRRGNSAKVPSSIEENKPRMPVRVGRNLSLNNQDFLKNIENLKLKPLISPSANFPKPFIWDQFKTPKCTTIIDTADIIDSDLLQRKSSGKFKTQEMLVNRIFNPISHRKKLN